MKSNHHYNKQLKGLARQNRNNMTRAEKRLWYDVLKGRALEGYLFNRQRPIDNYIVDFMCKELQLIVEVDGDSHNIKAEEDKERQVKLEGLGYTILRFTNDEVLNRLLNVRNTLLSFISEHHK